MRQDKIQLVLMGYASVNTLTKAEAKLLQEIRSKVKAVNTAKKTKAKNIRKDTKRKVKLSRYSSIKKPRPLYNSKYTQDKNMQLNHSTTYSKTMGKSAIQQEKEILSGGGYKSSKSKLFGQDDYKHAKVDKWEYRINQFTKEAAMDECTNTWKGSNTSNQVNLYIADCNPNQQDKTIRNIETAKDCETYRKKSIKSDKRIIVK